MLKIFGFQIDYYYLCGQTHFIFIYVLTKKFNAYG